MHSRQACICKPAASVLLEVYRREGETGLREQVHAPWAGAGAVPTPAPMFDSYGESPPKDTGIRRNTGGVGENEKK
jgi:hypothetical protein